MSAIQLSFSLRTSPNCKTVHLVGTWDGYKGQLPLSKDSSKQGAWKGTFRFQGNTIQQGQRYWYYYILDGYHVSHDPAKPSTTEQTTKRKLNVLDVPAASTSEKSSSSSRSSGSSKSSSKSSSHSSRDTRRHSKDLPQGRPVSPSRIAAPKPMRPNETKAIRRTEFPDVDALAAQLSASRFESDSESDADSDIDSDVPSLRSTSSGASSVTSASSTSSRCSCERYGITRAGDRVLLDCGGARCGGAWSSDEEICSDSDDDDKAAKHVRHAAQSRRHGVVIR